MFTEMNTILSDYLYPIMFAVLLMGVIVGVARNWDAINDNSGSGRRKEGLVAVVYIVGWLLISIVIVKAAVTKLGQVSLKMPQMSSYYHIDKNLKDQNA